MSGWRRVLLLVLVVLAALAGTRADVCLCGADRPTGPGPSAAVVRASTSEAIGDAGCCGLPAVEPCCCCHEPLAETALARAQLPADRATLTGPGCGCPGLDLSGLASEPAGAGPSLADDACQRSLLASAIDLAPAAALDADRVLAFASRAGPTTRPPPGSIRGHVVLRC